MQYTTEKEYLPEEMKCLHIYHTHTAFPNKSLRDTTVNRFNFEDWVFFRPIASTIICKTID